MSVLVRRHFLAATAAASVAGCAGSGSASTESWERAFEASTFSTIASIEQVPDGYLIAGTIHDEGPAPQGLVVHLGRDGTVRQRHQYMSSDQQAVRAQDPRIGPIPADWLSFARSADDGALLVGWTYYDGPAVEIARIYRTDSSGVVQHEVSLGTLENASAMSYLTDGIRTEDGWLLCGTESPGQVLGGAGWLVWVRADGSIIDHRRYPATDRDLTTTVRRDIFHAITSSAGGYVACGAYEPSPDAPSQAWIVGLDEDGSVRWRDVPPLAAGVDAVAFAAIESDQEAYDVLISGAVGEQLNRHRWVDQSPVPAGNGFVAAYTEEGTRVWLEELTDTPLMTAGRGPSGILATGSRVRRPWVGTVDRTDYQAAHDGTLVALTRGHDAGVVVGGRRIVDGTPTAWVGQLTDIGPAGLDHRPAEIDNGPASVTVEFLDCTRVSINGTASATLASVAFRSGDGRIGTVLEGVGPVDGSRTIDAAAVFDLPSQRSVLESVEIFTEGPAVPGAGERFYQPALEACRDRLAGSPGSLEDALDVGQ